MNQARRLAYLRAMGIDSYVRRDRIATMPQPSDPAPEPAPERPRADVASRSAPARELLVDLAPPGPTPTARAEVSDVMQDAPAAAADTGAAGQLRFSLRFIPINSRLSVIDEIPFAGTERIERSNELLTAILRALGCALPTPLKALRFNWPLSSGDDASARRAPEAQQALVGFLRRQLNAGDCRVLIVFASQLEDLFTRAGIDALLGPAGTRVIHASSLTAMLQVPELKRGVWETLREIPSLMEV